MEKRGFWWFSPFPHSNTIAEFRESHPAHADILEKLIDAKMYPIFEGTYVGVIIGSCVGGVMSQLARGKLHNRATRAFPSGISFAQTLVRVLPIFAVCISASASLGAHVGYNRVKKYSPHKPEAKFREAEAKFQDWLQNRASAQNLDFEDISV